MDFFTFPVLFVHDVEFDVLLFLVVVFLSGIEGVSLLKEPILGNSGIRIVSIEDSVLHFGVGDNCKLSTSSLNNRSSTLDSDISLVKTGIVEAFNRVVDLVIEEFN